MIPAEITKVTRNHVIGGTELPGLAKLRQRKAEDVYKGDTSCDLTRCLGIGKGPMEKNRFQLSIKKDFLLLKAV